MFLQCFHVNTGGCSFWQLAKFTKRNRRHDALQAAHVQKVSVCVTFGAPRLEPKIASFANVQNMLCFPSHFALMPSRPQSP